MIDPKECRIGNWVSGTEDFANYPMPIMVIGLDAKYIYFRFPGDNFEQELRTHEVFGGIKDLSNETFPIPLTPEIVKKCGFTWDGETHLGIISAGKDIYFYYPKNGSTTELIIAEHEYGDLNLLSFVAPKYLHHLQNIIFALTGYELSISL